MDSAKKTIRVAVYWFTNLELLDSIMFKLKKGVKVTLIIHNDYINNRETGLDFQSLNSSGICNHISKAPQAFSENIGNNLKNEFYRIY